MDFAKIMTKITIATLKVQKWAANNRKTAMFIHYLFFLITIPCGWASQKYVTWLVYLQLKIAKKANNENMIFQLCSIHIKNQAELKKWKNKVSKKWFHNSIVKQTKKLYKYAIDDKEKVSYNYFLTLIEIHSTYNIIGGAIIDPIGDTVITIE